MIHLALDGFYLVGALVAAVLVGIFASQFVKDKIKGVPSPLRAALKATESQALAALSDAEKAVVAEFSKKVAPAAASASVASTAKASVTGAAAANPTAPAAPVA